MVDWIKPYGDDKILKKYINDFILEKDFRNFAFKHRNVRVYASDFLIGHNKTSSTDIFNLISSKPNNDFLVVWMLSTVYKESFSDTINFGAISKECLMKLLLNQRADMIDERLVYVNDFSFTDFWDLMIFDESLSWSCVLTHEDDFDGKRICFKTGQSGDGSKPLKKSD